MVNALSLYRALLTSGRSKRFTISPNIHPFTHTLTHRQPCQPRRATASSSGGVRRLKDASATFRLTADQLYLLCDMLPSSINAETLSLSAQANRPPLPLPGGVSSSRGRSAEGDEERREGSGDPLSRFRLPVDFFHPVAVPIPAPPRRRSLRLTRGLRLTSPATWASLRSPGARNTTLCTQVSTAVAPGQWSTRGLRSVVHQGSRSVVQQGPQASLRSEICSLDVCSFPHLAI